MSQQTIVAVAITLAVVAVMLVVVLLWSLAVAMAMTRGKQSHSLRVACIVDSVRPEFRFIA